LSSYYCLRFLTPVTEIVQIRHYTDIPYVNPMASRDMALAQCFQEPSEIDLSRVLLFQNATAVSVVSP
jgi:hypothetical protein